MTLWTNQVVEGRADKNIHRDRAKAITDIISQNFTDNDVTVEYGRTGCQRSDGVGSQLVGLARLVGAETWRTFQAGEMVLMLATGHARVDGDIGPGHERIEAR